MNCQHIKIRKIGFKSLKVKGWGDAGLTFLHDNNPVSPYVHLATSPHLSSQKAACLAAPEEETSQETTRKANCT